MAAQPSAEALGQAFTTWEEAWRAHPKNMTLTPRPWYDCEDAQKIINGMSEGNRSLFNSIVITPHIERMISKENMAVVAVYNSVDRETSGSHTMPRAKACLTSLLDDLDRKMIEIQALDERAVFEIQQKYKAGSSEWFQSDNFRKRHGECQKLSSYDFLHDGICTGEQTHGKKHGHWMGSIHTRSIDECYQSCLQTEPCGYFAYDGVATKGNCFKYGWKDLCTSEGNKDTNNPLHLWLKFKTYRMRFDFEFKHNGLCTGLQTIGPSHNGWMGCLEVANISECALSCRNDKRSSSADSCRWFGYASTKRDCCKYALRDSCPSGNQRPEWSAYSTFRIRTASLGW